MPSAENAEGIFTWYYDTFEGMLSSAIVCYGQEKVKIIMGSYGYKSSAVGTLKNGGLEFTSKWNKNAILQKKKGLSQNAQK